MMEGKEQAARRGVFLVSRELGCPVNLSLTTRLHNYISRNQWDLRPVETADEIVIVSCSTLPEARQAVAAAVEHFATAYPAKRILVTCCFLKRDMVEAPNVIYIPLAQKDNFDAWFDPTVPLRDIASGATFEDDNDVRDMRSPRDRLNRPFNLLVSAGCLNHCSFCIGKSVFGTVQSVPIADLVVQAQEGLRKGYTNFIVGASDVASYGDDLGCNVTDLLAALFSQAFQDRKDLVFGFKGFEPSGFLRYFDTLKDYFTDRRVQWLCLPIQSGSNSVLKGMNRKYRIEDVVDVIKELRRLAPWLRIETDLIYCFPNETDEDFDASLKMLEHFDHVQMQAFQRHKTTTAAAMQDVFSEAERERRRGIVDALQAHEMDKDRPECRPLVELRLPSRHGASGFAMLKGPE